MTVQLQARSVWTRRPNEAPRQEGARKGVAVHWPGFRFTLADHTACLGLIANLERQAVQNGYAALPYCQVACPHGYLIEGRGAGRRSGANGSAAANLAFGSVAGLLSTHPDARPSNELLAALHASLAAQAPGGRLVTHAAVRPGPTACPGPALTTWLDAGAPLPRLVSQRTHTVAAGDTLWGLAVRYYRDGKLWTRIAEANDLAGTDLAPGDQLVIP